MTLDAVRAQVSADPYARSLGIELLELEPGYCRASLRLGPTTTNFQGSPHGAAIFSLADFAFSAACNSHGDPAVALSVTIHYLTAAAPNARLTAEAREQRQGKRAGFYGILVRDDAGTLIASAQAVAFRPS